MAAVRVIAVGALGHAHRFQCSEQPGAPRIASARRPAVISEYIGRAAGRRATTEDIDMPSSAGFRRFAVSTSHAVGSPWAFGIACLTVIAWSVTGPLFDYSNGWQLTINTGTTIVTFLMVFLIQHTQNRDAQVTQLKLDEL